jgi:hypothetical protein
MAVPGAVDLISHLVLFHPKLVLARRWILIQHAPAWMRVQAS